MALTPNCDWFHIVDWDEDTNEIIHAVCTLPSPAWPNCNMCQSKAEYADIPEEDDAVCKCCSSQAAMEDGLCELCLEIREEQRKNLNSLTLLEDL